MRVPCSGTLAHVCVGEGRVRVFPHFIVQSISNVLPHQVGEVEYLLSAPSHPEFKPRLMPDCFMQRDEVMVMINQIFRENTDCRTGTS